MLGIPVVRSLVEGGHRVRVLTRNEERARSLLARSTSAERQDVVEFISGSAVRRDDIRKGLAGCSAVHISLSQDSELEAVKHVTDLASDFGIQRVTYVSGATVCQENRWFDVIDIKMTAEEIVEQSDTPFIIFRPTWVMETLHNFAKHGPIVAIVGRNQPELHFLAGADFARMVQASFDSDLALGKRLVVKGPAGMTLEAAIKRYASVRAPVRNVRRISIGVARMLATVSGNQDLKYVTRLIAYFDEVGEVGDPTEANALLGAPTITLDEWLSMPDGVMAPGP